MEGCIFCQIVKGAIPTEFIYQDDQIVVLKDIKPVKPIHLLIIPKKHIKEIVDIETVLLEKIVSEIRNLVTEKKLIEEGYKIVVNGGAAMGVPHLHFHLLAPVRATEKI